MGLLSFARERVGSKKATSSTTSLIDNRKRSSNGSFDSNTRTPKKRQADKFYTVQIGDVYHRGRYIVRGHLGSGRYATVWLVKDTRLNEHFALKILNSDFYNGKHELFELEVMQRISQVSSSSAHPGKDHVAQMVDHFELSGPSGRHVCMIFDLLGASIAKQATQVQMQRLPYRALKQIMRQLLEALDFAYAECGIIHTDISPSNICIELAEAPAAVAAAKVDSAGEVELKTPLLSEEPKVNVRLNDFGIACFTDRHLTDEISPPLLRAPEVTLGAPWDSKVDIFNLGALLLQFLTGQLPFAGRGENNAAGCAESDRLSQLFASFGGEPDIVIDNADRAEEFAKNGVDLQRKRTHSGYTALEQFVAEHTSDPGSSPGLPADEVYKACDLLRRMLATDPRIREPAGRLLSHPWLANG
ncbi:hypothetical protein AAFC00_004295 [Neodothiora populina]|uniref:EKC/KEOPS complex subunit BUD32 n=1 Tax=Neodothiora populina TaxID=2781224 RepID=A0ABR3PJ75_9PEZI